MDTENKRVITLLIGFVTVLFLAGAPLLASDIDTGEGEQIYNAQCAACHQPNGQGIPGAFPPLAGHVPDLVAAEGGREYVINVLLYGLQGEIEVHGATYNGVMPPMAHLSDEQVADVLNYTLTAWDNAEELPEDFEAIEADEVEAQRGQDLSMADVHEQRQALELE